MSRREKEIIAAIAALVIAFIAIIATFYIVDNIKVEKFINNAKIVEVIVGGGHGVKHYECQFRPDFMSIDDYHKLIENLNDLPQNGEIYAGQVIKFYK